MSSPVVTVERTASLPGADAVMRDERIRHLPVVDDQRRLVGLVTHRDVLSASVGGQTPLTETERGELQLSVPVDRMMRRQVWTVRPGQSALDAARLLYDLQFGCAPVVDDERVVVGIVTEADFLGMAIELLDGDGDTPVSKLMTREVVTLAPDDELSLADLLMRLERIRHLPVVDADGALVGLLTHRDLLAAQRSSLTGAPRFATTATAADYMATDVTTVPPEASVGQAARTLVDHKWGCLPVVSDGRLAGIVTEADVLAAVVERLARVEAGPGRDAPVNYYMTEPVLAVAIDEQLTGAQDIMARHRVGGLAVVDEAGVLRGALSRTDLLRVREEGEVSGRARELLSLPTAAVDSVMTRGVHTTRADRGVASAAGVMLRKGVHRLFVVDDRQRPVGVVTTTDIMLAVRDFRLDAPIRLYASTPIFTATVTDSLRRVTQLLELADLSGVIIRDGVWPVGYFSREDALAAAHEPDDRAVEQVMSCHITCVPDTMPLYRVAAQAAALRVRRVLAMREGQIAGVVTGMDFARALAAARGA